MLIPQVNPYINIGTDRYYDTSITRFLCGLVGSSHIWIPNFQHWFGFISDFSVLFPNHKPCTKSSITTPTESSVKKVTPVHISTLICYAYSKRNGDKVKPSKVNDIGRKLAPKQWVSEWFSISGADALQITLSWFLCTLLIIRRSPVLMLHTALFLFSSGIMSAS